MIVETISQISSVTFFILCDIILVSFLLMRLGIISSSYFTNFFSQEKHRRLRIESDGGETWDELLGKYFPEYTAEEILALDAREVLDIAPTEQRFAMLQALKNLRSKCVQEKSMRDALNKEKIVLTGRVQSALFKDTFAKGSVQTCREWFTENGDHWPDAKLIDLSGNNLMLPDDLQPLLEYKYEKLELIDLNYNNLGKEVDDVLIKLAKKVQISIIGNPLVSVHSGTAFFEKLPACDFKNVIFIPEAWFEAGIWEVLLEKRNDKRKVVAAVKKAHEEFYGKSKKKSRTKKVD